MNEDIKKQISIAIDFANATSPVKLANFRTEECENNRIVLSYEEQNGEIKWIHNDRIFKEFLFDNDGIFSMLIFKKE